MSGAVQRSVFGTVLAILSSTSLALAQADRPEIYFVPDVAAQFNQLALRPEPFGFTSPDSFSPTFLDHHYQGIVRKHGPGTPYLFVTRNRDGAGYLLVVRMASRDTDGERLRSNRLLRNSSISPPPIQNGPEATLPDARDVTAALIRFDGTGGWPAYRHPGGMQLVGNILAVPLSQADAGNPPLRVAFVDVSNPEAPVLASQFDPDARGSDEFGVGQVALTAVENPEGPGVRYVMLLAGESNRDVRLYRSLPTNNFDYSTDLASPQLQWEELGSWTGDELDDPFLDTWPCCESKSHQMFSFVREQSLDGPLFLIGAFNPAAAIAPGGGEDFLDLYRVFLDRYGNPGTRLLDHIERKHVTTDSIGGDTSHFAGSTGVYVSPSGELIVYATEHTNQGPLDPDGRRTIRAGEWRHREMVRPDSPTLRPSVDVLAPSDVDEGSALTLSATGRPPTTRAWQQLFIDDGLGLSDDHFNTEVAIDYNDRTRDDYDDFTKLLWYFNDEASSWRWFAPQGCTIFANQDSVGDSSFPGRYKALVGDGSVHQDVNLDLVPGDNAPGSMNDMLSSVGFSCGDYYLAPIGVSWDLDRNGSFETAGESALVSAAALDGPSTFSVPVRAQHPTDSTPLGSSVPRSVEVHVRNVAPHIADFRMVDSRGAVIGLDVPFGIVGLEYSALGSFTDPGKPDRQTAVINWGDGSVEPSSSFRSFSDAFGGVAGQLAHGHVFAAAGNYSVDIEVSDDDGGIGTAHASLPIVTPEAAIVLVVAEIDALLGDGPGAQLRRDLEHARRALAGGSNGSSNDGALNKLAGGQVAAALAALHNAIRELHNAEMRGADVAALIALLEQIVLALASMA